MLTMSRTFNLTHTMQIILFCFLILTLYQNVTEYIIVKLTEDMKFSLQPHYK